MKRSEEFYATYFSADVLQEVKASLLRIIPGATATVDGAPTLKRSGVEWTYESDVEFFAEYRQGCDRFDITWEAQKRDEDGLAWANPERWIKVNVFGSSTSATVWIHGGKRADILEVQEVFERHRERSRVPDPPKQEKAPQPTIFLGHGRDPQWRDLKDHLADKQGYVVQAYEVGARAGHTIRDFLDDMLRSSTFTLLVLTAEDEAADDRFRARQNVVHELGLFQGRLGFSRAIAVVENGTELMTNMDGVQQLRFDRGHIASVFGDVLATLRREFGDVR